MLLPVVRRYIISFCVRTNYAQYLKTYFVLLFYVYIDIKTSFVICPIFFEIISIYRCNFQFNCIVCGFSSVIVYCCAYDAVTYCTRLNLNTKSMRFYSFFRSIRNYICIKFLVVFIHCGVWIWLVDFQNVSVEKTRRIYFLKHRQLQTILTQKPTDIPLY